MTLTALLGVYSDPARDPRHHTISTVYVGRASGAPAGGDDAAEARLFGEGDLPPPRLRPREDPGGLFHIQENGQKAALTSA